MRYYGLWRYHLYYAKNFPRDDACAETTELPPFKLPAVLREL